jgi:hypothetical protein
MDLDRKMIAVVVKADQPELFTIVRTLFHPYTDNGDEIDLTRRQRVGHSSKFDLTAPLEHDRDGLWLREDDPSLKATDSFAVTDYCIICNLRPRLFCSIFLPSVGRANAVSLAQWRQ